MQCIKWLLRKMFSHTTSRNKNVSTIVLKDVLLHELSMQFNNVSYVYKMRQPISLNLFFSCSSSALGELAVVVHGCCSAPRRLAILPALWVQHPPRTLTRPFILDSNEAAVQ